MPPRSAWRSRCRPISARCRRNVLAVDPSAPIRITRQAGMPAIEQRPEPKAGDRGALLAGRSPGKGERATGERRARGHDHRPGDVEEEREVPAVGPDQEVSHAPGFQTMSMSRSEHRGRGHDVRRERGPLGHARRSSSCSPARAGCRRRRRRAQERHRGEDPAVPELVARDVEREPDPEDQHRMLARPTPGRRRRRAEPAAPRRRRSPSRGRSPPPGRTRSERGGREGSRTCDGDNTAAARRGRRMAYSFAGGVSPRRDGGNHCGMRKQAHE